jgi:hypothetical protein
VIGGGFDRGDVTDEEGKDLVRENLATLAAVGAVHGLVERSKGADVGERAIETRDMSHAGIVAEGGELGEGLSTSPDKSRPSSPSSPPSATMPAWLMSLVSMARLHP